MITLITGAPGSGKTLYTISKLLRPLIGKTVEGEKDGQPIEYPRTIYTNINNLLLDHELIGFDGDQGLNTWHKWAKPGSVICFDEVQKPWPPRPNGSKVPDYIQHLETHRHMGVDFIVMTQHPMLIDGNLRALVGRHLHIRRAGNMHLAIVYEWDHCSRSLMLKNAFNKSPWRYDKGVFKLYKSAEVHTKQPRKLPAVVFFIGACFLGLAYAAPTFISRFQERVTVKPIEQQAQQKDKTNQQLEALKLADPQEGPKSELHAIKTPLAIPEGPPKPEIALAGCYLTRQGECKCLKTDGTPTSQEPAMCPDDTLPKHAAGLPDAPQVLTSALVQSTVARQVADAQALAAMREGRRSW